MKIDVHWKSNGKNNDLLDVGKDNEESHELGAAVMPLYLMVTKIKLKVEFRSIKLTV